MKKPTVVLVMVVLALLAARVAWADSRFTDPGGDSGGAPDISVVTAANDGPGNLTFTVTTNQQALAADGALALLLDTDKNSSTAAASSNTSCSSFRPAGSSDAGTARRSSPRPHLPRTPPTRTVS